MRSSYTPPFNYSRWKNIPEPSSLPDFFAVDVILLAVDVILRPLHPPLFHFSSDAKIFSYAKYHDIISCLLFLLSFK
jgi:hypothetical protein